MLRAARLRRSVSRRLPDVGAAVAPDAEQRLPRPSPGRRPLNRLLRRKPVRGATDRDRAAPAVVVVAGVLRLSKPETGTRSRSFWRSRPFAPRLAAMPR